MRILAALLCLVGVFACGSVKDPATDAAPTVDSSIDSPQGRALVSIAITGPSALHAGDMATFMALGTYDDATTADVTAQAQWSSSLPVATVATNQITGVAAGNTVITATVGIVHGNANLRVLSPHVLVATNYTGNAILFFSPTANGNVAPIRSISGAATTLASPAAVFAYNEEVYVVNSASVTVFPINGSGNIAPTRSITGALTTISSGRGLTVSNDEIYVGTGSTTPLAVFPATGTGNIAPTRTIGGNCGGCTGLAVVNNELYSNTYAGKAINVYAPTASGAGAVPLRTITDTTLDPIAMFVAGTEIYVGNLTDNTVRVYATTGSGATPALRTITGMAFPGQIAVFNNELYVPNYNDSTVRVFPVAATGAATPTRTISGALTTLSGPLAVFMY